MTRYKVYSRINERHRFVCFRMQYLLAIITKAFTEYCKICKILWGKVSDLYHSKCASVEVKLLTSVLSLKMLN